MARRGERMSRRCQDHQKRGQDHQKRNADDQSAATPQGPQPGQVSPRHPYSASLHRIEKCLPPASASPSPLPWNSSRTYHTPCSHATHTRRVSGPVALSTLTFRGGAGGRSRTDTLLPELDFESSASTNSATPAILPPIALSRLPPNQLSARFPGSAAPETLPHESLSRTHSLRLLYDPRNLHCEV